MAISYDKKIMECVLRSVMSEGNVAQGKAIKSICKSPKPLFITGKGGRGIVKPVPMEELEKSMINLSTGSEIDFAEFNL